MRFVLAALAAVVTVFPAAAQPAPVPADGKVTIPLTLTPTGEQKPTSRFLLQPQYTDLQPGEKIGGFLKCFMEQNVFFNGENEKKRGEWNELPLDQLPLDQIKQQGILNGIAYDPPFASLMVFMDQAARYDRVEWNIWHNLRKDGVYTLLPEVQKLRNLASVLKVRMRAEVKAGEFPRAAETAKTILGLARTMEQHPTLIGYLVGVAIAAHAIDPLEEMVQQPGCPNLYWGLTDLGAPVLDMKTGAQGERTFLTEQMRQVIDAPGPVPDEQFGPTLKMLDELLSLDESKPNKRDPKRASTAYKRLAADPKAVAAAREFLAANVNKPEVVKAYTPLQAVVVADVRHYAIYRDDMLKLLPLPLWQSAPLSAALDEDLKKVKAEGVLLLAPALAPSVMKVRQAQARLDQRVAYLRVIEAIRLHAHENGGRLPGSLDDIKLPLPPDPVTGKPFSYNVKDGGVAVLHGENPNPGLPATNRYYEIRLRK